ncbi:MAG TPA: CBS domain-containing protein [Bradyrhizobium sp.]|uniref:CBS domain-containing protein n=1 Tax=Bradyrhizobium sp. TaxID=376 RepID=UPI002D80D3DE|nr:CBS domain-containing protein [Bradyrhizobium sp.]HET7884832.1 CBS domain-containing protein [Bradyrhizobium sp.]
MYEFLEETARQNMASRARTVAPEMTVGDLLRLFDSEGADGYPVLDGGVLVGIVSKADALKAFALVPDNVIPRYDDMMGTTVGEVMSRQVTTVEPSTPLQRVLHLMVSHHFKILPVISQNNHLEGVITRDDVIAALARLGKHEVMPLTHPPVGYYAIA